MSIEKPYQPSKEEMEKAEGMMTEEEKIKSEERENDYKQGESVALGSFFKNFEILQKRARESTTSEESYEILKEAIENIEEGILILKRIEKGFEALCESGKRVHKYPDNPKWRQDTFYSNQYIEREIDDLKRIFGAINK